ncbi:alpha/beta hydrolase family protein [Ferrovibrio sp.]|uniref:alpha/beta hydrolase family protein n=1 Tax=Ferrovibrio sp. TaxID=1917215 RepID=UPI0035175B74
MRRACLSSYSLALLALLLPAALAAAVSSAAHAAGLRLVEIPAAGDAPAIEAAVWSPCATAPGSIPLGIVQIGPFALPATRDCPVAGSDLPLVVISHGYGGSFLGHHDTAAALAAAGFVVAALNHPGDNARERARAGDRAVFVSRPRDIGRLVDYMLGDYAEAAKIDAARIGMFGFSRGGYTTLAVAGGRPDFLRAGLPCPDPQAPLCRQMRDPQQAVLPALPPDARIRAAVIADPLNAFPGRDSLQDVRLPLQVWASEQGGQGVEPARVAALQQDLPVKPDFRIVRGAAHFAFLAPCPADLAARLPELCVDAPGFDRVAFHRDFNAAVTAFFRQHLGGG